MYDWEADLIAALNDIDADWRSEYTTPEEAARVLIPDYPGLIPDIDEEYEDFYFDYEVDENDYDYD